MTAPATKTEIRPIEKICTSLAGDAFKQKLQQALPPNLDVERYARTAINAIQMHPQKDKFNNCDIQTLFLAVQKAATDGLSLDGREATLTAFWNKKKNCNDISYIPMVQGLVKVARNSGEISSIDAHVVYASDQFRFRPGTDPQPIFEPDWKTPPSERGEPVLAYCTVTLKDGTVISPEPMHSERIMQIGNAGNNGNQYNPKTGPHYAEWWKKTAIKNALKYAPKSSELLRLEEADNSAQQFDFDKLRDVTSAAGVDINEVFKPKPKLEAVDTEALEYTSEEIEGSVAAEASTEAEKPAQEPEENSPAFQTLRTQLLATRDAGEAKALRNKPAIAKMNKAEVATFGELVDKHVEAIEAGMLPEDE